MGVKPLSDNNSNNTKTKDYELPKEEGFPARCIAVIGLGTHRDTYDGPESTKTKEEVMLIFELSELMEDGKPFCVTWRGTFSMGEKANLTKLLVAWRNRDFTDAEKASFSLPTVLGVPSLLTVKNKGDWSNVGSIAPLPKAMSAGLIEQVNPTINFGVHELGENPDFDNIWPWVKKIISNSVEGQAYKVDHPTFFDQAPSSGASQEAEGQPSQPAGGDVAPPLNPDDDIPF